MNETANPKMVSLARELLGLSQQDLSKKVGVTQSAISKIEKGVLPADRGLMSRLSNALGVPQSFFCLPFDIYPAPMQFYRKHKTLPARMSHRIEALLNIYRLHSLQLLQAAEIDFKALPECDLDMYANAREAARAVRQFLRLPRGPIENVVELLEDHGILIIPFDAGTHQFSGVSMLVNTANYLILVNSRLSPDKYRSTLIHEFAHILLHQLPSADMETEANEFEGEFAMPSDLFVPEVRSLKGAWARSAATMLRDLAALKRYWKMPISAIVTHASKLKVFTEWETRQIWMTLAKAGITRKTEPLDPTIGPESPSLIRELVEYHISELGYSVEQMSAFLGMYPEDFLDTYKPNNQPLTVVKNVPKLSLAR